MAPLIGKMVRFEAKGGTFTLAEATLADAEAFWASRHPQPFAPAHDDTTTGFPAFADVVFGDAKSVGVKAANLFRHSMALSTQVHSAMVARGFTGEYRVQEQRRPTAKDLAWLVGVALLCTVVLLATRRVL